MGSRNRTFRWLYRLGFTPWDGHPLANSLRDLVEGSSASAPGTALDLGCGTGDNAIYLADHGWRVTGVDYIDKPLTTARAKAGERSISFLKADVTQLRSEGVGDDFDLIIDSGCLHGMSDGDRDAYVREVTAVAATGARLLIVAFVPGASFGVPGIDPADVERRFSAHWVLQSSGDESVSSNSKNSARFYLFDRAG
jgi:ubiquinone/menaquinone biosynthesis C-methylase UbiE